MKTSIDFDAKVLEAIDEVQSRESRPSRTNVVLAAFADYVRNKHPDLLEKVQKKPKPPAAE